MSATEGSATPSITAIDAPLVEALHATAGGDRQAFERLYRLSNTALFATCRRVLGERHEAEEALQETYLKVWRNAHAYDATRGRPMTWLITVAHRCAIDRLRARPANDVATAWPEAEPPAIAATGRLATCLRTLAQDDAGLLRTAFFEGATYADIARQTATPLGTVKSRIRRALQKLAECLR